jgi:hypothetical protein
MNKLYFQSNISDTKNPNEVHLSITAGKNDNGYDENSDKYCRLTGIIDKSLIEQLRHPTESKELLEEVKELLTYLNIHNSIDEEEGRQIIMRINKLL